MTRELYVLRTNVDPIFLDPRFVIQSPSMAQEAYDEYAHKALEHVERCFPFVALLKDHDLFGDNAVLPNQFGGSSRPICPGELVGIRPGAEADISLADFIDDVVNGLDRTFGTTNLIVRFAPTPIYEKTITDLEAKYTVHRIDLD